MPAKSHEERLEETMKELERVARLADKHEFELHGPRGVYAALVELGGQLTWNNRALWAIAAAAIIAALLTSLGLK